MADRWDLEGMDREALHRLRRDVEQELERRRLEPRPKREANRYGGGRRRSNR